MARHGVVDFAAQGLKTVTKCWKGAFLMKVWKVWLSCRLSTGDPPGSLAAAHIPCPLQQGSFESLSFFKTSAFLLFQGSMWLDQTRSESSPCLQSRGQRSCRYWQGSGGWHRKRQGCYLLPPWTELNLPSTGSRPQHCLPGCLYSSERQKWIFFLTRIILYFEVIFLIKLNYVV